VKLEIWQKIIFALTQSVQAVEEDVLIDEDEVKAFGELALLQRQIEGYLRQWWDQ
jgi:hypothetical protein